MSINIYKKHCVEHTGFLVLKNCQLWYSKETGVAVVTINNWHGLYSEVGCTSRTAYLVKKTDKTDYTSFRAVSVLSRRYKSYT